MLELQAIMMTAIKHLSSYLIPRYTNSLLFDQQPALQFQLLWSNFELKVGFAMLDNLNISSVVACLFFFILYATTSCKYFYPTSKIDNSWNITTLYPPLQHLGKKDEFRYKQGVSSAIIIDESLFRIRPYLVIELRQLNIAVCFFVFFLNQR